MNVWGLVGLLFCFVGCGPQSHTSQMGGTRTSWSNDQTRRGSFEAGSANLHTWGGEPRLVVWSDVRHSTGTSGSKGGRKEVTTGEFQAAGGRAVKYSWETADGRTEPLVLDGKEYELGRGGLLLVSLRGPEPRVAQLDRDLPGAGDFHAFLERCKDDPEVQAFFAAGK